VRAVLDRDDEARARDVALVTGAGFGLVATESLVLSLLANGIRPASVVVAAAASSAHDTLGVRTTVAETMADGATTYVGGELVRAPIGQGATTLTFGGVTRPVVPVPVGDLEAARHLTGAPDVIAYTAPCDPSQERSFAYAAITDPDGVRHTAELATGEGFAFTAAIAAETAIRLLGDAKPGAWTPSHLLGLGLAAEAPDTTIHIGR
jgi:saccharopine dehydrogenase (NAD+, L-lysine-forming)